MEKPSDTQMLDWLDHMLGHTGQVAFIWSIAEHGWRLQETSRLAEDGAQVYDNVRQAIMAAMQEEQR